MKDMLKMQKDGDAKSLALYVQSLTLPNPDVWFLATFGDELGKDLSGAYERTRIDLPLAFPDMLNQLRAKHLTDPKPAQFSDSCDPLASADEYAVLERRTGSQPLYDVRFSNGSVGAVVRYFAYVDGNFRYLGNFKVNSANQQGVSAQAKIPREEMSKVAGNVMMAKLIRSVPPHYPEGARSQGIQGTVILHAIIGKNGAVCNLQVVQGDPLLSPAAINAVSQWRYSPVTLNGQPVEVTTTITVIFQLGR